MRSYAQRHPAPIGRGVSCFQSPPWAACPDEVCSTVVWLQLVYNFSLYAVFGRNETDAAGEPRIERACRVKIARTKAPATRTIAEQPRPEGGARRTKKGAKNGGGHGDEPRDAAPGGRQPETRPPPRGPRQAPRPPGRNEEGSGGEGAKGGGLTGAATGGDGQNRGRAGGHGETRSGRMPPPPLCPRGATWNEGGGAEPQAPRPGERPPRREIKDGRDTEKPNSGQGSTARPRATRKHQGLKARPGDRREVPCKRGRGRRSRTRLPCTNSACRHHRGPQRSARPGRNSVERTPCRHHEPPR